MYVVRLVLLDYFLRHYAPGYSPNEIHFGVSRSQSQPRFEDRQHAAVEKKQRAD